MHADADVVFIGGEVHTLGASDETYEAVAVRDGRITRLDSNYEAQFGVGVETDVIDLDGRVLLPGFVDSAATLGDGEATRGSLRSAAAHAIERGITTVHDRVAGDAAGTYRDLAADGTLPLRVEFDYGYGTLDALTAVGARTGDGSERVQTGAVALPSVGDGADEITPSVRRDVLRRADDAGLRIAARATDAASVGSLLDEYEAATADPGASRHRIVGIQDVTPDAATRLAEIGVVTVVPPGSDAVGPLLDVGAHVAFGWCENDNDGVYDPLAAVDMAVERGVGTTTALRAATAGGACAGGEEERCGTLSINQAADFTVLERSPWAADSIADVDVAMTVVDGEVVHDAR